MIFISNVKITNQQSIVNLLKIIHVMLKCNFSIVKNLNLDQDVAGATFMAAGSSAPEVFISLIGIFFAESNPSIGAIVGSAIFNILFVIGLCGLFILGTAKLTIWPFFRDSVFYCVAILLLVLVYFSSATLLIEIIFDILFWVFTYFSSSETIEFTGTSHSCYCCSTAYTYFSWCNLTYYNISYNHLNGLTKIVNYSRK